MGAPGKRGAASIPVKAIVSTALDATTAGMVEALTPYPLGTAGPHLNTASTLSSQWGPPQFLFGVLSLLSSVTRPGHHVRAIDNIPAAGSIIGS